MTDNDDDPEIEYSSLSGPDTENGITVQVHIYRIAGSSEGWALEAIDMENNSTTWDDLFATDADAMEEFKRVLAEEGILDFVQSAPTGQH